MNNVFNAFASQAISTTEAKSIEGGARRARPARRTRSARPTNTNDNTNVGTVTTSITVNGNPIDTTTGCPEGTTTISNVEGSQTTTVTFTTNC